MANWLVFIAALVLFVLLIVFLATRKSSSGPDRQNSKASDFPDEGAGGWYGDAGSGNGGNNP